MIMATCHPDKRQKALGLCSKCYQQKKSKKSVCHPEKREVAKGLCISCYHREYRKDPEVKQRCRKYNKEYRFRPGTREKILKRQMNYHYQTVYGLSTEQYLEMLSSQKGVCFLCKKPPSIKRLSIDHDHKTGMVRGILCARCNLALSVLEENPGWETEARKYLAPPTKFLSLSGTVNPAQKP